ncbi:hypothetical protein PENTCL1PPCAC_28264, partial [Pristionchus entomophagus]
VVLGHLLQRGLHVFSSEVIDGDCEGVDLGLLGENELVDVELLFLESAHDGEKLLIDIEQFALIVDVVNLGAGNGALSENLGPLLFLLELLALELLGRLEHQQL